MADDETATPDQGEEAKAKTQTKKTQSKSKSTQKTEPTKGYTTARGFTRIDN